MTATRKGGLKASKILLARDPDYFRKMGRKGGKASTPGGFGSVPGLASRAGSIGGKRRWELQREKDKQNAY